MKAQQLIAAADQMLYQAKHLGRNRAVSVHSGHADVDEDVPPTISQQMA